MTVTWKLEWCDSYRDGGSYGATLSDGSSSTALLLQVGPWDHPDEIAYRSLYVSRGELPTSMERELPPGSDEESAWIEILARCDASRATEQDRRRWSEMVELLRPRLRRSQ